MPWMPIREEYLHKIRIEYFIYLVVGTLAALNSNAESRIEAARVERRLS